MTKALRQGKPATLSLWEMVCPEGRGEGLPSPSSCLGASCRSAIRCNLSSGRFAATLSQPTSGLPEFGLMKEQVGRARLAWERASTQWYS
jgi:hypothetical protein